MRAVIYKIICWLITPIYLITFFGILLFFHPVLVLVGSVSRKAHKFFLDLMNYSILLNMRVIAGTRIDVFGPKDLPEDKPIILISNHQSMYDIPLLMWTLRKKRVGFVSKKELGKGIPSISYSLRHLDSVLIDRKDASLALPAIKNWGYKMAQIKGVASIFPEGTRAKNGKKKVFKQGGVLELMTAMPEALIQPVVITGAWEILQYNFLPVPWGTSITCTFLEPIENDLSKKQEIAEKVEAFIAAGLDYSAKA